MDPDAERIHEAVLSLRADLDPAAPLAPLLDRVRERLGHARDDPEFAVRAAMSLLGPGQAPGPPPDEAVAAVLALLADADRPVDEALIRGATIAYGLGVGRATRKGLEGWDTVWGGAVSALAGLATRPYLRANRWLVSDNGFPESAFPDGTSKKQRKAARDGIPLRLAMHMTYPEQEAVIAGPAPVAAARQEEDRNTIPYDELVRRGMLAGRHVPTPPTPSVLTIAGEGGQAVLHFGAGDTRTVPCGANLVFEVGEDSDLSLHRGGKVIGDLPVPAGGQMIVRPREEGVTIDVFSDRHSRRSGDHKPSKASKTLGPDDRAELACPSGVVRVLQCTCGTPRCEEAHRVSGWSPTLADAKGRPISLSSFVASAVTGPGPSRGDGHFRPSTKGFAEGAYFALLADEGATGDRGRHEGEAVRARLVKVEVCVCFHGTCRDRGKSTYFSDGRCRTCGKGFHPAFGVKVPRWMLIPVEPTFRYERKARLRCAAREKHREILKQLGGPIGDDIPDDHLETLFDFRLPRKPGGPEERLPYDAPCPLCGGRGTWERQDRRFSHVFARVGGKVVGDPAEVREAVERLATRPVEGEGFEEDER